MNGSMEGSAVASSADLEENFDARGSLAVLDVELQKGEAPRLVVVEVLAAVRMVVEVEEKICRKANSE